MPVYDKAVRDRIPEIIRESGRVCRFRAMDDAEFLPHLERKLREEVDEYLRDKSVDELADVLEVVHRIAELRGVSPDGLEEARRDKAGRCGRFERNLFLEDVRDAGP